MSNRSNKVPLVVLKQVGVLIKYIRLKVSVSSEKWLSFSPLDPDTLIFESPATKILSYLFIAWLIVFDNSWKKTFLSYCGGQYVNIMRHSLLDIKNAMQIVFAELVLKFSSLLASNSFLMKTIFPIPLLSKIC